MKKSGTFTKHDSLPLVGSPFSRRMFLSGMGSSLAIPFLPSLAFGQSAGGADLYYIFSNVTHGRIEIAWNPRNAVLNTVAANVKSKKLADINGPLGYLIGNRLDKYRSQVTMLQGLDAISNSDHYWFPWSASCPINPDDKLTPLFPWSIDTVLAGSPKLYPTAPAIPVLRIDPKEASHTYSWAGKAANGNAIRNGATGKTIKDTWAYVSKGLNPSTGGGGGAVDPGPGRKKLLVDRFLSQTKAVISGRRISSEDKLTLQNFVDQLNEVEKRITPASAPAQAAQCTPPNLTETTDNVAFNRRLIDIMTLAMACGLTRVAMYHLNWASSMSPTEDLGDRYFPNVHDDIHNFNNGGQAYLNQRLWWGNAIDHYAYMISKMDSYGLLNKSAIVFTSDMSSSTQSHHGCDMPVLCAGGLGGKLVQGELISFYRQKMDSEQYGILAEEGKAYQSVPRYSGRRYNEFLITLMAAAGLTPADYQRGGGTGFGTYDTCLPNGGTFACGANATDINPQLMRYYQGNGDGRAVTLPYYFKG